MFPQHLTHRAKVWIVVAILLLGTGWLLLTDQMRPKGSVATPEQAETPRATSAAESPMVSDPSSSQAFAMVTPARQQLIGVKTALVEKHPLDTTVRAVGRVDYNEQRITHVNLRISGWVDDLFVDYTGQLVRKGQPLFTLYSPDLVSTQDEYLLALRTQQKVKDSPLPEVHEQAEELVQASRERLRLWTVSDQQLNELVRRGKANTYITISSPNTGYVIDKKVFKGMFVEPQMQLYTIADLSTVWINAEIYEFEVPFVKVGQTGKVTFTAYPGRAFYGRVSYIYPFLNPESRTVKVRLELPNAEMQLKPEMYGDVEIQINRGYQVAIPEQAVLDSGTRKLVFLVRGEGLFEPREVTVGSKIGSLYEVQEGLEVGDRIVTSGNFLIDSESKLMAATDMMGSLGMGGIKMEQAQMGKMDMGGMPMGSAQPGPATQVAKASGEKKVGGVTLAWATEPAAPRIGENVVRVSVNGEGGKPVSNAKVHLTYTMPMPGMLPATVPMTRGKDGSYEAKVNLGMGGQWDLTVTVQRAGQADIKETFSVTAGGGMPSMPGM
ncbi:MAG: FixH family protein [Nitrospirales bacterium]|nr:FixH family protein [Nitrospirales bacterium]